MIPTDTKKKACLSFIQLSKDTIKSLSELDETYRNEDWKKVIEKEKKAIMENLKMLAEL